MSFGRVGVGEANKNKTRRNLQMRKCNVVALLSLVFTFFIAFAALPVFAAVEEVDMHSFVDYRDGVLYVFHISTSDPVSVHI
ncbi:MAG: hypothetical protein K6U74_06065, partial [Firmicutes bacterium]|nr:hypothetical protein [Bacillota bacterium]